jgi:hypothetical protein
MRESLRIIYQCLNEMPDGLYKSPDGKVRTRTGQLRLATWSGCKGHTGLLAVLSELAEGLAARPLEEGSVSSSQHTPPHRARRCARPAAAP